MHREGLHSGLEWTRDPKRARLGELGGCLHAGVRQKAEELREPAPAITGGSRREASLVWA